MGEMIAMIAHQWRQPLNNLSLANQFLINKFKRGKLSEDIVEYFKDTSKKQIEQMSTTIDDFRNFFRTEKVKISYSINKVIDDVLQMTEPIYVSNSIEVKYTKTKECRSYGYPNELGQAFINILNNAKDALVENSVEDRYIVISLNETDDGCTIAIEDNAGGIPEEIIDKIFDPYFSTKGKKNGTGLGLYMTKMIIQEQLDADLSVENTDNGAKFTIFLKGEEYVAE
jgi:signal transduction histidine kinase